MKVIKVKIEDEYVEFRASEDGTFFCLADLSKNIKGGGAYYTISKFLSENVDSELRHNIDGNLYVNMDKFIDMIETYKDKYPRTTKDYTSTLKKALVELMQNIVSVESKKLNALEHAEESLSHLIEAVNILKKFDNLDGLAEIQGTVKRLEFENKEQLRIIHEKEQEILQLRDQVETWEKIRNLLGATHENKKGNKRTNQRTG